MCLCVCVCTRIHTRKKTEKKELRFHFPNILTRETDTLIFSDALSVCKGKKYPKCIHPLSTAWLDGPRILFHTQTTSTTATAFNTLNRTQWHVGPADTGLTNLVLFYSRTGSSECFDGNYSSERLNFWHYSPEPFNLHSDSHSDLQLSEWRSEETESHVSLLGLCVSGCLSSGTEKWNAASLTGSADTSHCELLEGRLITLSLQTQFTAFSRGCRSLDHRWLKRLQLIGVSAVKTLSCKSVRSKPKRLNILIANFSWNYTCSITLEKQQAHLCHHMVNFRKLSVWRGYSFEVLTSIWCVLI